MISDHFTRVLGGRPLKSLTKKEKQDRELSWNPRFYIERMPTYNAAKDKYLQSLVPGIKPKKTAGPWSKIRKIRIRSPKNNLKSDSTKRLHGEKGKTMRTQMINKLKSSIETVYEEKNIPVEIGKAFFESLENLDPKTMINLMSKTLSELNSDKNSVQFVVKAVKAREDWIDQAKAMLGSNPSKHDCTECVNNLRILSIHAVECIENWAHDKIHKIHMKNPQNFTWNGENYLIKMSKDLGFFKNSGFSHWLGEAVFETFIPNFLEKPKKSIEKRFLDCEKRISEALGPPVRETPFEMRLKKKTVSHENLIGLQEDFFIESGGENIEELLEDYAKKVPEQIKNCLGDPAKAYSHALTMKFPAFFWVRSRQDSIGLFTLNIDNQKTTQTRLLISHISSKSLEYLETVIALAVNYASSNYPCDEIRVALLSPANSVGKYESDKQIKNYFDKLGFRWKILLKDENAHPIQLLGLACKKSEEKPNQCIFKDSIFMNYSCKRGEYEKNSNTDFISAIGIVAFLKYSRVEKTLENAVLQNVLEKSDESWVPPAFRMHPNDMEKNTEDLAALCSVGLNWVKFLTSVYSGYKYSYIYKTSINVMKSGNNKAYIIPTEDQNFSIFIIPFERLEIGCFEQVQLILGNITTHEEVIEEIWLPEFYSKTAGCCIVKNSDKKEDLICKEFCELNLRSALHSKGNIILRPRQESVVIKSNFLFGLMHSKIDEDYEVPYISAYIKVEDFILAS